MLKEIGYQEKIEILKDWLEEIIETVKKDLKTEHLKIDRAFCRKYFLGKAFAALSAKEMTPAYEEDIKSGNVGLGEFIASRWLLKNTDIYGFFEQKLKQINPDFDEIEELDESQAGPLLQAAIKEFGPQRTYIFSIFNSVAFPESISTTLKDLAQEARKISGIRKKQDEETKSLEVLKKRHEREVSAITDRFEKKLKGMERKYLNDTQSLKKQIGALQRKLTHD